MRWVGGGNNLAHAMRDSPAKLAGGDHVSGEGVLNGT